MKFLAKAYNSYDKKNVCVYDEEEYSLYTLGISTNGSLVVDGTYISFDLDIEEKEVKGISGFVGDLSDLKPTKVPDISIIYDAQLVVDTDEEFISGVGYSINSECEILYDKSNREICILPLEKNIFPNECYRIAKNIFVALSNGVIEGILIRLEDYEKK